MTLVSLPGITYNIEVISSPHETTQTKESDIELGMQILREPINPPEMKDLDAFVNNDGTSLDSKNIQQFSLESSLQG